MAPPPSVSVVVIGYNDAANIGHAIRSATRQSLKDIEIVVVDDGSTDDMAAVTARLAAADARIRVIRLADNSGGCSRPRNVGVEAATGDYVTFLDSDDLLPRRAAARLLAAARSADSDMACGRFVRVHHRPRRHVAAHDELYLRPAVLDTIVDRPEQLFDTPCVGKLYRRSFLLSNDLRFPEGLLYEDLLFTTQAYCAASGIAIIPSLSYIWNVRRSAGPPSITNRRELRNWTDRFEVHRRIDTFLDGHHAGPDLRAVKDRKFMDADFVLFLRELRVFSPDVRPMLLDVARGYVAGKNLDRVPGARLASRIGVRFVEQADLSRTLAAADYSETGGVARELLVGDVGAMLATDGLGATFSVTPFLVTARRATVGDGSLRLDGDVYDVLDRLAGSTDLRGTLEVSGRLGGRIVSVPVNGERSAAGWSFSATIDLAEVGRRMAGVRAGHELRLDLVLVSAGEQVRRPLSARDADLPAEAFVVATPWRRLVGDRLRLTEVNGRLVLQLVALPRAADAAIEAMSRVRHAVARGRLRRRGPERG